MTLNNIQKLDQAIITRITDTEDTINKSLLLNWLYASDKNLPIEELKKWIEGNTNGKYSIVKQDQDSQCFKKQIITALSQNAEQQLN